MSRTLALLAALVLAGSPLAAQDGPNDPAPGADTAPDPATETETTDRDEDGPEPPMTLDRLDRIVTALDPQAESNDTAWQLSVDGLKVMVITDAAADRMRIVTPVRRAPEMTQEELMRVMQANFDTALDARYAIAQDLLWSTFIHPLSPLERDQFISGLGQVVNLVRSYGTLYSGGALRYGGGDSGALQRKLIDDLLEKGKGI